MGTGPQILITGGYGGIPEDPFRGHDNRAAELHAYRP